MLDRFFASWLRYLELFPASFKAVFAALSSFLSRPVCDGYMLRPYLNLPDSGANFGNSAPIKSVKLVGKDAGNSLITSLILIVPPSLSSSFKSVFSTNANPPKSFAFG